MAGIERVENNRSGSSDERGVCRVHRVGRKSDDTERIFGWQTSGKVNDLSRRGAPADPPCGNRIVRAQIADHLDHIDVIPYQTVACLVDERERIPVVGECLAVADDRPACGDERRHRAVGLDPEYSVATRQHDEVRDWIVRANVQNALRDAARRDVDDRRGRRAERGYRGEQQQ